MENNNEILVMSGDDYKRMQEQFTPGPWETGEAEGLYESYVNGIGIGNVSGYMGRITTATKVAIDVWGHAASKEETEETAKLIASAPNLIVEIEHLRSRLKMSNYHLYNMLAEMESAFDVNEKFESPKICLEYVDAALYCQKYFGRDDLRRIDAAREWYNNQPS